MGTQHKALAQKNTELVNVTNILKINTACNITVTKDGTKAAFTITSIESDAANKLGYKYLTQVFSIATNGNELPIQLTSAKEGTLQPAWSPDGKQLAFVRIVDGKSQVFILTINDGGPIQLTNTKYGATSPKWSPDGKQLIYASTVSLQELLKDSLLYPANTIRRWSAEKPGFYNNYPFKANKVKPNPDGNLQELRA